VESWTDEDDLSSRRLLARVACSSDPGRIHFRFRLVALLRKHYPTTQNVLAIVDFGLRFTYVLAGWKDQLMTPLYSKMHCHVLMSLELKNKVVDKTHSISFWLVK
jgi:hypothetical protein